MTSTHGAAWVQRIALGSAHDVGEVHVLSGGRLGFVADGDLYSISGTCTAASCAFPGPPEARLRRRRRMGLDGLDRDDRGAHRAARDEPRGRPARRDDPAGRDDRAGRCSSGSRDDGDARARLGRPGRAGDRPDRVRLRLRLAHAASVAVTVARAHQKAVVLHVKEAAGTRVLTVRRLHGRRLRRGSYTVTVRVGTQSRRLAVRVR